ncbi:MAG: hypothetical protein LUD81_05405 [Clostridiales bacterium]|nr:hypothetical protein [Clostridiales bacterium]
MFKYGMDDFQDGNKELIAEFLNIFQGGNKSPVYPENIKYPFINSLWVSVREGKRFLLTSGRYDATKQFDECMKQLGVSENARVNIKDDRNAAAVDIFNDYAYMCVYEGFLNGYLTCLNIINGKMV